MLMNSCLNSDKIEFGGGHDLLIQLRIGYHCCSRETTVDCRLGYCWEAAFVKWKFWKSQNAPPIDTRNLF